MTPRGRRLAGLGVAFAAGLLFGVGLAVSGMTRPAKVIGFLDFFGGAWDPSLMFVMGGAVVVTALAFRLILKRRRPLLADSFAVPDEKRRIDARLVGGAAMFGVGWGLGGFCPGPGFESIVTGAKGPIVFTASMVAGMLLFEAIDGVRLRRARASMPSLAPETVDDA